MIETSDPPDLAFIHLSDIHFREGRVGDLHDADAGIRNELERDLRRIRSRTSRLDGIIISGDVAFGGQVDEYTYAQSWIESVREQLDCPPNGVMVIPGNHDVDRTLIPDGGDVERLQNEIKDAATMEIRNATIANILRDPNRSASLLGTIGNYNAFAGNYGCAISAAKPYWDRDFKLRDGTTLRFRGITTTFISGPHDDVNTHKMAYGGAQLQLLRLDNVRHAIIGHHPPSWTYEGDEADRIFSTMTVLQLFGHKHDQWFTRIGKGIRLIAGAMHPDRREPKWLPRYSLIMIRVTSKSEISFRVYPRRWSDEELMFIGDFNSSGLDYRDYAAEADPAIQPAVAHPPENYQKCE